MAISRILAWMRLLRPGTYGKPETQNSPVIPKKSTGKRVGGVASANTPTKLGTRAERISSYRPRPKDGQKSRPTKTALTSNISESVATICLSIGDLLPIDNYVSSRYNADYVRAVICWGFIRPKQNRKFVGLERRAAPELIFRTLIQKNYSQREVQRTLDMLIRQGVVSTGPQGGLALNLKPELTKTAEAREIVRCAAVLLHRLKNEPIAIVDTASS